MTATEEINKFIEDNTKDTFGSVLGYVRTRDALNIALARIAAAEAERDVLRATLDDIKAETIMPDGTRLSDAVK